MPRIDEIKERINRKYAYDYEIGRSIIKETSSDKLLVALAEGEKRLPRFGETVVNWDWHEGFEYVEFAYLRDDPPEEEIYRDSGLTWSWKDDRGRVWYYNEDSGRWFSKINLMTWVRAIRDELSERLSRESDHLQIGYDS